ncbi:MAG: gluconate permease [Lewinellaceae bacterium]|nr:gluconate permease [Lewinellaceae bacterium]
MLTLLLSIALLLALIIFLRLNAFISLIISAVFAGLASGMGPEKLLGSLQSGIGGTLGGLVLILALGIVLGSLLAETGAVSVISKRLIEVFGERNAGLALCVTGFVVGIAMFYNAGFVVLAPLVYMVAASSGQSLVALAIAMAAPLSVTHGFLPPHPGATAVANVFGADLGKTLLLGMAAAIPAVFLAGIVFPRWLRHIPANPPKGLFPDTENIPAVLPGFYKSLLLGIAPVLLMASATIAVFLLPPESAGLTWIRFIGDPGMAMLLTVLAALFLFGRHTLAPHRPAGVQELLEKASGSLGAAASLLLVIAAGGAYKQVLVDSGIGNEIAKSASGLAASPLLIGWAIATLLRIAVGSATVAGITAAGIAKPIVAGGAVSPELMTLAIGAGSLMCSHVNDTGFWMFKEWFGLSLRDTFRSWTLMETIVGVVGLAAVLLLDLL